ncbi:DUF1178 family protein [Mitsuaria sp. WAJ17]|uniref:DUF1178 family protein n=1 Tax=Mitsuaria sp. WAJ17 TaxID=2761452 RepID=UPI001601F73A|nr:DUF1178 family protein [Mitsuaria sp. WAJ17]MBB2485871.1 DUF1178 family protein [Mitsuaria sp. WAJ17]
MVVLNLACESSHAFEGWFASSDDCRDQQARGLLSCPVCGSSRVERRPSAPRLNVAHLRAGKTAVPIQPDAASPPEGMVAGGVADGAGQAAVGEAGEALQSLWMAVSRELARHSEDVGERFAEEARRIHYGDAEERAIRGRSQPEEVRALMEEGIELLPLLLPKGGDGELH